MKENNADNTSNIVYRQNQILWQKVFLLLMLHIGAFYGFYCLIFFVQWKTIAFGYVIAVISGLGITAGAHRLWSHSTYKAKLPLRIILAIFQTIAFQKSIYEWVRDHRVHHKFTDTNADPHNSTRGFFFCHIGWVMIKKHNDVIIKGKMVDISDLEDDSVLMLQKRCYNKAAAILSFVILPLIPWYFWKEDLQVSFFIVGIFRYVCVLHATFLVNSAAHMWGTRPYDKNINPTENPIAISLSFGEGFHNYHHTFPWDYKAAELGNYKCNITTVFIDFMAKIGWAYDLKTASKELIEKRVKKTGDGTQKFDATLKENDDKLHCNNIWGWADKDMKCDDKNLVEVFYQKS